MILLLLFLGLLLLSIIYPKSKYLTITMAVFMLFSYAFMWHKGDLEVYEWVYRDLFSGHFYTAYEPGFIASMWICKKIGLSFTGFRFVLGLFITFTIYKFVRRQTDYSSFAMALYCLFPFFVFSSVLRSGVASVFVLLAIEQLISAKGSKKKFVLLIILGTVFHYSALLFLPFLLFTLNVKKEKFIGAFVGMCVLAFVINKTNFMYSLVSMVTQRQKILSWLIKNEATANFNGIIAIAILLLTIYLLSKSNLRKSSALSKSGNYFSEKRVNQFLISYQMSIYMIFISPLMVISSPIMRVPYMVFLLFIISTINAGCGNNMESNTTKSRNGVITLTWLVLLFVVFLWKIYADLPYLKSGAHFFGEFLDAQILW